MFYVLCIVFRYMYSTALKHHTVAQWAQAFAGASMQQYSKNTRLHTVKMDHCICNADYDKIIAEI